MDINPVLNNSAYVDSYFIFAHNGLNSRGVPPAIPAGYERTPGTAKNCLIALKKSGIWPFQIRIYNSCEIRHNRDLRLCRFFML